ncbi:MAG: outer membrane lipoprotein carrier protein LolA [Bacteroidota bacterium]
MKLQFSLLTILSIFLFSFTSNVGPDDKAARILQSSQKKLENLNDFTADFSLALSSANTKNNPLPMSGSVKYSKGKYVLMLKDLHVYCNKQYVWEYIVEEEASKRDYDAEDAGGLESIFQIYREHAKAQYQGVETVGGKSCHRIYVAISDPSLEYNQATIWIDARNELPQKVKLKTRAQTEQSYKFENFKLNVGLSDKDFIFVAPEGITVYDETE